MHRRLSRTAPLDVWAPGGALVKLQRITIYAVRRVERYSSNVMIRESLDLLLMGHSRPDSANGIGHRRSSHLRAEQSQITFLEGQVPTLSRSLGHLGPNSCSHTPDSVRGLHNVDHILRRILHLALSRTYRSLPSALLYSPPRNPLIAI